MPSNAFSSLRFSRLYSSFSSSNKAQTLACPKLKNISHRIRARALSEARIALVDYLHATRALPFSLADHISSHSPYSLSRLLSRLPLSPSNPPPPSALPSLLRRFLSYRPVNEFDFFSESIGLSPLRPVPSPSLFLSDHPSLLAAVSALASFGFPCAKLGLLYQQNDSIFQEDASDLLGRLRRFESFGLRRTCVIAVCLTFPWVLNAERDLDADSLFHDLRAVFVDYGLGSWTGEDVDEVYDICQRIRVFYDRGSVMGTMGAMMGERKEVFLKIGEEVLAQKLDFFLKLGMEREEAGVFVLQRKEMLDIDLKTTIVVRPEILTAMGLAEEEAAELLHKYPYVVGKNKLGNLPGILRAMGLQRWFLNKVRNSAQDLHWLLMATKENDFVELDVEKIEREFLEDMERTKSKKKQEHLDNKVELMLSIGFGKNTITSKIVSLLNGPKEQLQERFDCLVELGIEYNTLCRMISATPKLLNQSSESIHEKVNYLQNDLGYPLEYLDSFPAFLCFDLENRIKPRFKIMNWLKGKGLLKKHFSPATVLANAERRFIVNLYGIHPAAPKQWLEIFSSRTDHHGNQRSLFAAHP